MRRTVFTIDVLRQIPQWVAQNIASDEIAAKIGCTPSSLKATCSKMRISLRTPNWRERRQQTINNPLPARAPVAALPRKLPARKQQPLTMQTSLALSRVAMSRLYQHAERFGMTEAQLATELLEAIAQDDLYAAVLDRAA